MYLFSTLLLSMFITIILIPCFKGYAVKMNAVDIPNQRKIHKTTMPKIGGLAMAIGALVPILFWSRMDHFIQSILAGASVVVIFGFLDDIKNLGYKTKFTGQIAAALIVILYGGVKIQYLGALLPDGSLLPNLFSIPLTLIFIVGITNAINLSDGLDGLAGGISILTFIGIGYLAYLSDNSAILLVAVAVTGAIFGFLRFNTFPAVIFMGDAGSQALGFIAAVLSISITQSNSPFCAVLPLLLTGFPVLDTLTVMTERIIAHKPPFMADKRHFHHRLLNLGFFHTEAVLLIYIFQALLITAAVLLRFFSEWFILIIYLIFSGTIIYFFLTAKKTGARLARLNWFDKSIKGRLKILKEKKVMIKISFKTIYHGIPLLLLATAFIPVNIPIYFSIFSIMACMLILASIFFKKKSLCNILRLCLYLSIPFLIFISESTPATWINSSMTQIYNLSFGFLVFFVIMTLKFTNRQHGFKTTPMDFLILFVALVVPNLPAVYFENNHLGLITAKIIVFLFSYEVIVGELRGESGKLGAATAGTFMIIFIKGFT
ncbi:MAG: undecaprenyl/decaprenyl-phosphate alpha-N-acetylglucosaminyl 1-phosphate transferase [Deltaproteobacteria bacterium]|nr:undecaprenyl/decaprenyl-phosphate alpha-N-acetylglucosaminyl 1-phosphate transferase [Deltaproteobacteria bacterium]